MLNLPKFSNTQGYYFQKYLIWGPENRNFAKTRLFWPVLQPNQERIGQHILITTVQIYLISIQQYSFSKHSERFQGTKINPNSSIPRPNRIVMVIGRAQFIVHRSPQQIQSRLILLKNVRPQNNVEYCDTESK